MTRARLREWWDAPPPATLNWSVILRVELFGLAVTGLGVFSLIVGNRIGWAIVAIAAGSFASLLGIRSASALRGLRNRPS
jgi:hypothetical protein